MRTPRAVHRHPLFPATALALALAAAPVGPGAAAQTLVFPQESAEAAGVLGGYARESMARIADFFGAPFTDTVTIRVVPDRAAFDAALAAMWGLPETACWMVGAAGATELVVLSTDAWGEEACEHDPADQEHVRGIVAHELVHAYHGQHNPAHDFDGMDPMGWFVEGLAVLASEQLRLDHGGDAADAVAAGAAPTRLADGWSGRYRYGVAGSMAAYIDRRWGRGTLVRLLSATSNREALDILGTDERSFLDGWRAWVTGGWAAEREVLDAVQRLWNAMHDGDGDAARSVFAPDARLVGVGMEDGRRVLETTPAEAFAAAVARGGGGWNERMYDPEVRIDGDIASVWTFYTFHRGEAFSHCGIDSFELANIDGWKVTQVADTRRTDCFRGYVR